MSKCARPGCPGTVRGPYCDYCGFAPLPDEGPATQPWQEPRERPGLPETVGRPGPYGPLEMARVPSVPYRDPKKAPLIDTVPLDGGSSTRLRRGELVSGQYKVHGCLALGGLGRIYLAYDNNVGHWVVLKGLLDADAADGGMVVAAERAALAAVNHPNIVKIHNFVQHPAPETGVKRRAAQSYIVMEYVGGRTLKQLLDDRRRQHGPAETLPVDHVIAYGIEMLRALGYLHERGLLYCDLKPANVMQSERRLTLIDLGATRRLGNSATGRPNVGTTGFHAPEVAVTGPSIRSDIYTVGRTMAVLSFAFDYTGTFADRLPARDEVPLLTRFESYDRLLRRATDPDPNKRFRDTAEMVDQLFGVLREVIAADGRSEPWPVQSTHFGPERRVIGTEITAASSAELVLGSLDPGAAVVALPVPLVSPDLSLDVSPEASSEVSSNGSSGAGGAADLAELAGREPREIIKRLTNPADPRASSAEAKLVLARAFLDRGGRSALFKADRLIKELAYELREDWRLDWYRGLVAVAAGRFADARRSFDDLCSRLPGETAPRLALAFCCEGAGAPSEAAQRYKSVWQTDRGCLSAAFGLARVLLHLNRRDEAVRALDEVPALSTYYGAAQLAAMAVAVRGRPPAELTEGDLLAAEKRLTKSRVDGERWCRLAVEVLEAALKWVLAGQSARPYARLLKAPMNEDGLRRKLEDTYRTLARYTEDIDAKHALVIKANAVRPRTFF